MACILMLASCSESGNNKTEEKQKVAAATEDVVADTLNIDGYINRARWLLANQQVGNAIRDINSALSIDSKNIEALLVLADVYYALGDQDNILLTLNKASEIAPMDSRPVVKLAELSFLQGNINMANAYIDKALELNSMNPQAYYMRGIICMSRNDTVQALKQFMKARNQDDSFIDPVFMRHSVIRWQKISILSLSIWHRIIGDHIMIWRCIFKITAHRRRLWRFTTLWMHECRETIRYCSIKGMLTWCICSSMTRL